MAKSWNTVVKIQEKWDSAQYKEFWQVWIICDLPQFRQKYVKIAAKNDGFERKFSIFLFFSPRTCLRGNPEKQNEKPWELGTPGIQDIHAKLPGSNHHAINIRQKCQTSILEDPRGDFAHFCAQGSTKFREDLKMRENTVIMTISPAFSGPNKNSLEKQVYRYSVNFRSNSVKLVPKNALEKLLKIFFRNA